MTANLNYPPEPIYAPDDAQYVLTAADADLINGKLLIPGPGVTIMVSSGNVTISATPAPLTTPTYITRDDESYQLPNSFKLVVGTGLAVTYSTNSLLLTATGGGSSSGTVTNVSAGNLSPLFTTNVANPTTTPSITYTLVSQSSGLIYAGPASGSSAVPTFRLLALTDLPSSVVSLDGSQILTNKSIDAGQITGALPVLHGGTGSTTASGARTNLSTPVNSDAFLTIDLPSDLSAARKIAVSGGLRIQDGGPLSSLTISASELQPLDPTLTALAAFNTNGLVTQTAPDTFTGRTLQSGDTNYISVTNGNGVSGDPTVGITSKVYTTAYSNTLNNIASSSNSGMISQNGSSFIGRTITGTASHITVTNGDGIAGSPTIDLANNTAIPGNPTTTTQAAGDNSTKIATTAYADNAVANKALTNSHVYVGNASNVAADVAMSGDVTIDNTGNTTIGSNKVSNSKFRQSAAHSVVGTAGNATANVADIASTAAHQILGSTPSGTLNFLNLTVSGGYLSNDGTTLTIVPTSVSSGGGGSGSVISVSSGNLSPWFNTSVSNPTTTPSISYSATGNKGDLPYYSAANTAANLPIGANSQFLAVATDVPAWTNGLVGFASATSNLTLSNSTNSYIGMDASSSNLTMLLSAASSMPGKIFWFKNITVTGSNTCTVSTNGTDTIEGSLTSTTVPTLQVWGIISDGVKTWRYLKPRIESPQSGGTGISTVPTLGQTLVGTNSSVYQTITPYIFTTLVIDGASSSLISGEVGEYYSTVNGTIQSVTILADQTGSCVFNIYKSTYSSFPTMTSIVASAKPTLTSAQKSQDTTLSGWTTTINDGDCLKFVLESASTITRASITLKILRTG